MGCSCGGHNKKKPKPEQEVLVSIGHEDGEALKVFRGKKEGEFIWKSAKLIKLKLN